MNSSAVASACMRSDQRHITVSDALSTVSISRIRIHISKCPIVIQSPTNMVRILRWMLQVRCHASGVRHRIIQAPFCIQLIILSNRTRTSKALAGY